MTVNSIGLFSIVAELILLDQRISVLFLNSILALNNMPILSTDSRMQQDNVRAYLFHQHPVVREMTGSKLKGPKWS